MMTTHSPRPSGPRFAALLPFLLAAALARAQLPAGFEVPSGHLVIDDMIIPEAAFMSDGAWTPGLWPNAVVPFTFDTPVSSTDRATAAMAMASWEAVSAVRFVPRTNESDYVTLVNNPAPDSNFSAIGKVPQGGQQFIFINTWNWATCVHEIGHSLGYIHEHMRSDRNSFVTIEWGNVIPLPNLQFNFALVPFSNNVTSYDFDSIMHYPQDAFSRCPFGVSSSFVCPFPLRTITVNSAFSAFQNSIGQRTHLSIPDAQGMAAMYGAPSAPTITGLSPASVVAGTGGFTLTITGNLFHDSNHGGSGAFPNSRATWDGMLLATTVVDAHTLTATVPNFLNVTGGVHQIRVDNAAPGGGTSVPAPFTITCTAPSPVIASMPVSVTAPCSALSITPGANLWNAVGVSSNSDFDFVAGSAFSNFGSNYCDFVVGNGTLGPMSTSIVSTVRSAGTDPGTVEHVVASLNAVDSVVDSQLTAGHILRLHQFQVNTAGDYDVTVTGSSNLLWDLYDTGSNSAWRPRGAPLYGTVGVTGTQTITLTPGTHAIVIIKDGGPSSTSLPYTINFCTSLPPIVFAAAGSATIISTPCRSFVIAPSTNWNTVAVHSSSDWDVTIGTAESQNGGTTTDFVVANGHLGTVNPTAGMFARFSGTAGATGMFVPGSNTLTVGATTNDSFLFAIPIVRVWQFNIVTPGNYDLTVGGGAFDHWFLFRPGSGAGWRTRAQADLNGTIGATSTAVSLTAVWHAIVAVNDAGTPTFPSSATFLVTPTPNPLPVLTSISPSVAAAGAAAFTMTLNGSGFIPQSVASFGGVSLATTFVNATQLTAVVPATALTTGGFYTVNVNTPAPGGGTSAPRNFTLNNPLPVITVYAPTSTTVGHASLIVTVIGTGIQPTAIPRLNGTVLTVMGWYAPSMMDVQVPASLLATPGPLTLTMQNPLPGGGTSGPVTFTVLAPVMATVIPGTIVPLTAISPPVPLVVTGSNFSTVSVVHANGVPLPTTFVNATTLHCTIGPNVAQTHLPGGVTLVVSHDQHVVSNSLALVIGGGTNRGTLLRVPLNPTPGQSYTARFEGFPVGAPFTVVIDSTNPPPMTGFPTAAKNCVLSCYSPAGLAVVLDGIGLYGPAQGWAFAAAAGSTAPGGRFEIPGIALPNPALGVTLTVQTVYLDPSASSGWNLSWARYPDSF